MELKYPIVFLIGIVIIIIISNIKKRINITKNKTLIANTKYIKNTDYFKKKYSSYNRSLIILKTTIILCLVLSFLILSRVSTNSISETEKRSRDIMLCIDVSTSIDKVNKKLLKKYQEIVKKMDGERFGITIFNTSPVVLVPLTDDYDYVNSALDKLHNSIDQMLDENHFKPGYDPVLSNYRFNGTLVNSSKKGSSLIGNGLASCAYNFPKTKDNRGKVIIFSTDNELSAFTNKIITLKQAAKISASKNIIVFGIAPDNIRDIKKKEFEEAVEITNGKLFLNTLSNNNKIINSIETMSKTQIKKEYNKKVYDIPQVPLILLVIALVILFIYGKKVNL